MAKADGQVLISLDIDDNTKAPIEKAESRMKELGKGAGDELEKSMKSNANKAEGTAKKASNVIEGEFKKPVSKKLGIKADEAKKELKSIDESTAKLVKGNNDIKVKVTGDASDKIKEIYESKRRATKGDNDINLDIKGNAKEKIKETTQAMDSAKNKSLKLKDVIAGTFVGGALTSGIGIAASALSGLGAEAISSSDAINKFKSTMELGGFGSKEINSATKEVQKYANETVYDLGDVSNTTAQLAANGIKNYTQLTEAAGNLNAQAGGNADTFKSVAMMLTQTAGAGKLTTENWNQLADAIPGASGVLQAQMKKNGAFTGNFRDAMAAGKISSQEFSKAITQLGMNDGAKKAAKSTTTFEGAIGNLEANVVTGVQNMINAFGKSKFTNAINSFSTMVTGAFGGMIKGIKIALPYIDTLGTTLGKILKPVGKLVGAIAGQVFKSALDILGSMVNLIAKLFGETGNGKHKALDTVAGAINALAKNKTAVKIIADSLIALMGYKMAKSGLNIAVGLTDKLVMNYAKLSDLPGIFKNMFAVKDGGIISSLSKLKGVPKTISQLTPKSLGSKALTEGGAAGKLATGAAGAGVALSAGLDIYKAFKAKNPESKFKNAGKGLGTAIGGGLGLFFGGPLGAALGATIGKVIGGWGGKGAKLFTDGWNKKGRGAKPPKGFLPKVGYYARAGGDAIVGWGKGFARGVGKVIKSIGRFNKRVGKGFGTVVKIIGNVLKPIKKVLEYALVIPIALVVGLAIKAWSKMKKPFKVVINFILKVVKSGWKIIKSITKSTWRAFEKYVINPVKAVWRAIDKYIIKKIVKAIRSAWKGIKSLTRSTWNAFKRYIVDPVETVWNAVRKYIVKLIVNNIKSAWKDIKSITKSAWNLIKKYAVDPIVSVYDKVKSIMGKMKKVISSAMGSIKNVWHSAWSNVSDFFTRIWKSIKDHAKDGINAVIGVINSGINGIDGVINAFGGKKHAIGRIGKVHFATGTGSLTSNFRRSIDRMTPAVVNDRPGASNPELIYRHATGNVEWMKGRNAETMLMPGDEVANDRDSALLAPQLGISHFASGGIGSFFSGIGGFVKGAVSGAVSTVSKGAKWLKNLFTTATKIIGHPVKSLEELFKYKKSGKGIFKSLGKNMFGMVKDKAVDWWKSLWSMVDLNGSGITGGVAHTPGAGWKVTSGFGSRGGVSGGYSSHDGVDFSGARLVRAMLPGIVSGYGGAPSGWGGSNGIGEYVATHGLYNAIYQELNGKSNSGAKILVKKGETVKAGDPIAKLGPNASHVHVGVTKHPMFSIGGSSTNGWLDVTKLKSAGKSDKKSKGSNNTIRKQVGSGFWKLISKIAGLFGDDGGGSGTGDPGGAGVQRWKSDVKSALSKLGLSTSASMVSRVLRQINTESSGNPKAMGGTDGLADGHAEGLMQVKPGTFSAYHLSGHGNIWNGYDNILAGLNYAKHRYGSGLSFLGNGHGYANGGIINGLTRAILGEDPLHPKEHVINTGKPSSDGLLADAISTRAKNNPSGVYAQMQSLITSAHNSQRMFGTQLQTGSSLQDTVSDSKLLKQMAADMHKTAQKDINGDVYLGTNKVGSILEQRKNKKDFNSQFFAGQLKNQGGLN
ncbi:tape measure protein [Pediococcus pentosaceus]|uniref:tape measure protein n=1 Tax=Pediococcus pentosaceus TaxID=1255 RepID=UPI00211BCFBF|nr:tape measure protein [Pediococcus pentosaceus]MCQ9315315.1 tape measure protein [Pediococcus pentosaceus]MCQ9337827.1 tape measure protein [Pediococcus pentosaceus]